MILDPKGKKVVVIGGRNSVGRAIAETVAREGADVVIWLRKWNDDLNQAEVLPLTQIELPSKQLNGKSPRMALWRQTVARKSYW
jgi:NAD(P)-dependent dehydrogenase (short-subunit alcohol dehydrogenase family)